MPLSKFLHKIAPKKRNSTTMASTPPNPRSSPTIHSLVEDPIIESSDAAQSHSTNPSSLEDPFGDAHAVQEHLSVCTDDMSTYSGSPAVPHYLRPNSRSSSTVAEPIPDWPLGQAVSLHLGAGYHSRTNQTRHLEVSNR
jgi:hypothetical protein